MQLGAINFVSNEKNKNDGKKDMDTSGTMLNKLDTKFLKVIEILFMLFLDMSLKKRVSIILTG